MRFGFLAIFIFVAHSMHGQTSDTLHLEDLRQQVLSLKTDVDVITVNLQTSHKKFKQGIFVATLGYTVTITGGLMLGRKNDELGKVLLVSGGTIGCIGTVLLVDSFKYLGRVGNARRKEQNK
jgi:hypothetical protein